MKTVIDIPDDAILSYVPPETVCAIGALTSNWHICEFMVELLICDCLRIEASVGAILTTPMGNVTRIDVLESLAHVEEPNHQVRDLLLFGAKLFNRNRENRNAVVHGMIDFEGENNTLHFVKRDIYKGIRRRAFPADSSTVWGVARDIKTCSDYLSRLDDIWIARSQKKRMPLPQKPPLPDKMNLSPLD